MTIERKRRQIHRIRIAAIVVWLAFVVLLVFGGVLESAYGRSLTTSTIASCRAGGDADRSVSHRLLVRPSVSIRFDSVQQALAAIQERLAQIQLNGNAPER